VQWAHAIAPGANILLVEANSNSWSDLMTAVNYARNQLGVSVVSMSWGGSEWLGEAGYDGYFTTPSGHGGVTFVASSGDSGSFGAPVYPSVSPNVLAVGGTQLSTNSAGNYLGETGWGNGRRSWRLGGSGGGISAYESQPGYQKGVVTQSTMRTVPDVAYNASSSSPFAVYDTFFYSGWLQVYGTSAGSPQWSALVAIANQGRVLAGGATLDGPSETLFALYNLPASDFHDITSGSNGAYSARPSYDLVTGIGTPLAKLVVSRLVSYRSQTTPLASTSSGSPESGKSPTQTHFLVIATPVSPGTDPNLTNPAVLVRDLTAVQGGLTPPGTTASPTTVEAVPAGVGPLTTSVGSRTFVSASLRAGGRSPVVSRHFPGGGGGDLLDGWDAELLPPPRVEPAEEAPTAPGPGPGTTLKPAVDALFSHGLGPGELTQEPETAQGMRLAAAPALVSDQEARAEPAAVVAALAVTLALHWRALSPEAEARARRLPGW
jgi:hypothetical protein